MCTIAGVQPKTFQDKGGFVELGHYFNKHFVKNAQKKDPQCLLLDAIKTAF